MKSCISISKISVSSTMLLLCKLCNFDHALNLFFILDRLLNDPSNNWWGRTKDYLASLRKLSWFKEKIFEKGNILILEDTTI